MEGGISVQRGIGRPWFLVYLIGERFCLLPQQQTLVIVAGPNLHRIHPGELSFILQASCSCPHFWARHIFLKMIYSALGSRPEFMFISLQNTIIINVYSFYKYKYLLIIIIIIKFNFQTKIKEKKKNQVLLKFSFMGYLIITTIMIKFHVLILKK